MSIFKNTPKKENKLNSSTNEKVKMVEEDGSITEELVEKENIDGTPFAVIGSKEKGYFLILGRRRITEVMKTKEEVLKYIDEQSWYLTTQLIIAIIEDKDELLKMAKNKNTI